MNNPVYSIPYCYAGERNTERIKAYRLLAEQFNIDESTVAQIFNAGIDFAIKQVKEYSVEISNKIQKY